MSEYGYQTEGNEAFQMQMQQVQQQQMQQQQGQSQQQQYSSIEEMQQAQQQQQMQHFANMEEMQQAQQQHQNMMMNEAFMNQMGMQQQQQAAQMYAAMGNAGQMMMMPYMQMPMYTRMALPSEMMEEQPTYVNAKQYRRIITRRQARAKLESRKKIPSQRKNYLHESRHKHACRRPRGPGGRFLTKEELEEYRKRAAEGMSEKEAVAAAIAPSEAVKAAIDNPAQIDGDIDPDDERTSTADATDTTPDVPKHDDNDRSSAEPPQVENGEEINSQMPPDEDPALQDRASTLPHVTSDDEHTEVPSAAVDVKVSPTFVKTDEEAVDEKQKQSTSEEDLTSEAATLSAAGTMASMAPM